MLIEVEWERFFSGWGPGRRRTTFDTVLGTRESASLLEMVSSVQVRPEVSAKGTFVLVRPAWLRAVLLAMIDEIELLDVDMVVDVVAFEFQSLVDGSLRDLAGRVESCRSGCDRSPVAVVAWNCSQICLSVLGYYHVLLMDCGESALSADLMVLNPASLFALYVKLRDGAGNVVDQFSYRQFRCVLTDLDEVVLEPGQWSRCCCVERNAKDRGDEFSLVSLGYVVCTSLLMDV